jgi:hypothetical protein
VYRRRLEGQLAVLRVGRHYTRKSVSGLLGVKERVGFALPEAQIARIANQ